MCQLDATSLYENLRSVLKHFSMSLKSTELLGNALKLLEMNPIHVLNWGSTRMSGFLDACKQLVDIIVPFIDTIIAYGIRKDESSFLLSPKGIYLLHVFSDIHPIFANKYLHKVDSDDILI